MQSCHDYTSSYFGPTWCYFLHLVSLVGGLIDMHIIYDMRVLTSIWHLGNNISLMKASIHLYKTFDQYSVQEYALDMSYRIHRFLTHQTQIKGTTAGPGSSSTPGLYTVFH